MIAFYRQWAQTEVQHEMVAEWMLPDGPPPPDVEDQARAAAADADKDKDLHGGD